MTAFIRFRSIVAILIISAVMLLCGCSDFKQSKKPEQSEDNVSESIQTSDDSSFTAALYNDFASIEQFVERHVQDFKDSIEQYKVRQANYNVQSGRGSIEGYYSDDMLKYVEVHIYGEMERTTYNIYHINESLCYFAETSVKYDGPIDNEGGYNIVDETRKEYLIIEGRIHEYTDDLKPLSDEDAAVYTKKFGEFEKALKNAATVPAVKKEPSGQDENAGGKTVEELKNEGLEVFEDHSFDLSLEAFGDVRLITGSKEDGNGLAKLKLYLADKDSKLVYELPDFYGNKWPMLLGVSAVAYGDADNDGLTDVIVIAEYITGAGENGAAGFPAAGVYFQSGKGFVSRPELDEQLNDSGANSTIGDVMSYLAEAGISADAAVNSNTIVPVAFNGLLAGSYYNGRWLDTEETVTKISGNIRYSVYSNFKHIGNGTGSLPYTDAQGRDYISVDIENAVTNNVSFAVAVGRTGNVAYSVPRKYSNAFYFDIVKVLVGSKIENKDPKIIIQGVSADLNNDGKEEHLISVSGFDESDSLALNGWYRDNGNFSYLLLAEESGNGFEISVIAEALRSEADSDSAYKAGIGEGEMMISRSEFFVIGLVDIDGDSDLELICREDTLGGSSYYVFEYDNGRLNQVLGVRLA